MPKMNYWDEELQEWVELDAKDADTLGGKPASHFALDSDINSNITNKLNLNRGISVINSDNDSPLNVLNIKGRTLVNLLGRDGNFENGLNFTASTGAEVSIGNVDPGDYGSSRMRIDAIESREGGIYARSIKSIKVDSNKYYIAISPIKNNSFPDTRLRIVKSDGTGVIKNGTSVITGLAGNSIAKISPEDLVGIEEVKIDISTDGNVAIGTHAHVDGIRIYEITQDEYNSLDAMTSNQIAQKYPYVDDVKGLTNPYIKVTRGNLLPPLTEWKKGRPTTNTLNIGNIEYHSQYDITLSRPEIGFMIYTDIKLIPGETYSLNTGGAQAYIYNKNNYETILDSDGVSGSITFEAPEGYTDYWIGLYKLASLESVRITEPMLNIGSEILPFEPQDRDALYLQTSLHSNVNGDVYDSLSYRDGKYYKIKRFEEMVLNGSLDWYYGAIGDGFKHVRLKLPNESEGLLSLIVSKHDGKILFSKGSFSGEDIAHIALVDGKRNELRVSISNKESGWGQDYTPTPEEIKAYFNGWKMYQRGQPSNVPYNGVGEKAWGAIDPTRDFVLQNTFTPDLPTNVSKSINDGMISPYRLIYQLANPTEEEIQFEGALSLHEGDNQIEVGEGIVVRELTKPAYHSGYYRLNYNPNPESWFKYLAHRIINVYKNGILDTHNWQLAPLHHHNGRNGLAYAYIEESKFDTSAVYSVTYEAAPYWTSKIIDVESEYFGGVKKVLGETVHNVADIGQRVGSLQNQISSGNINAGKLAGIDSDSFIFGDNQSGTIEYRGDLNDITKSGFYYAHTGHTNGIGVNGFLIHHQYPQDNEYCTQIIVANSVADDGIYKRRKRQGVWEPWKEVGGGVKNVQRGLASVEMEEDKNEATVNISISAVDLSKSFVNISVTGHLDGSSGNSLTASCRARLKTSTSLELFVSRVYLNSSFANKGRAYVAWEVIEYA